MISLKDFLAEGQTVYPNLLLKNYSRLGMSSEEFLLWLQLFRESQSGNLFPDMRLLASILGLKEDVVYKALTGLIEKKFIGIETKEDQTGKQMDTYNLMPTFEKFNLLKEQDEKKQERTERELAIQRLFLTFQQEFGRDLTMFEHEILEKWLEEDQYEPALIELALKEAVLNQVYNLNYIDKILLEWERKNIQTKQQVLSEQKRRRNALLDKETSGKDLPKVTLHNWLEGETDA